MLGGSSEVEVFVAPRGQRYVSKAQMFVFFLIQSQSTIIKLR